MRRGCSSYWLPHRYCCAASIGDSIKSSGGTDVIVTDHDVGRLDVVPAALDVVLAARDVGRRPDVGRPVALHGVNPSRICLLIQ